MSEPSAQNRVGFVPRVISIARSWFIAGLKGWDRFLFAPSTSDTLAVLRVATGAMLLYSHLVLASDLMAFIGPDAWIDHATSRGLLGGTLGAPTAAATYLNTIESPTALWAHHVVTLVVTAMFMVGLLTRITAPLAVFLQLVLLHRLLGSLFGLDQIATYCAMYLAITPCGACLSIDAWIRERMPGRSRWKAWLFPADVATSWATLGTRLLQLHLCVIYLFGGLAKARGQLWWDGTALWFAVSNRQYQSLDVTFLAGYPVVFTALTHLTLFWEVFYSALVWPRWTRPVVLLMAVAVHGGIAVAMGMITFGIMMITANGVFIRPDWIRRLRRAGSCQPAERGSPETELEQRLSDVEIAEEGIRKRYGKLKRREARLKAKLEKYQRDKRKLRAMVQRGRFVMDESEDGSEVPGSSLDLDDPSEAGGAEELDSATELDAGPIGVEDLSDSAIHRDLRRDS
ncbi:MAG: HTTM domain-containing protein [Planctomycetota bacterium]